MIRQHGFTLLEISIAMIIMAAMVAISTRTVYLKLDTRYTEHTAAEVWVIGEYAQKYIQENDEWPDQTANGCVNAITTMITDLGLPAGTIPDQSPWGNDYETSCNTSSFSITTQLDDNWAPALTNMLAVTQLKSGTTDTTITTLPLPGSIAALSDVLKRVDTGNADDNTMETDLNMGNFDIDSVGTINVQRLDADLVDVDRLEADLVQAGVQVNVMSNYIGDPAFALNAYGKDDTPSTVQRGEPRTQDGSIYVNDMYMRSIGGYISSRLPNMVEKMTYTAMNGDLVPKPSCPIEEPPPGLVAGAHSSDPEPRIKIHPAEGSYAIDYDDKYWEVNTGSILEIYRADVYCYYPPADLANQDKIDVGIYMAKLIEDNNINITGFGNGFTYAFNDKIIDRYDSMDGAVIRVYPVFDYDTWEYPAVTSQQEVVYCVGGVGVTCENYPLLSRRIDELVYVNNIFSEVSIKIDVGLALDARVDDVNTSFIRLLANGVEVKRLSFDEMRVLCHPINGCPDYNFGFGDIYMVGPGEEVTLNIQAYVTPLSNSKIFIRPDSSISAEPVLVSPP